MQKKHGMILNQRALRFIGRSKMLFKFLKQLFCVPHHYEQEESLITNEYFEVCKKCGKVRKIKIIFGSI